MIAHPRGVLRLASADDTIRGRGQLELSYKGKLGLFGGAGYRTVDRLESGGPVIAPATGEPEKVPPAFEDDGRTQRGTGFDEFTADVRPTWQIDDQLRWTMAWYDYRQTDSPRTDKCPPPTAPADECLIYEEQFRDLVYSKLAIDGGPDVAHAGLWTVSFQEAHERRKHIKSTLGGLLDPRSEGGVDDVRTVGTRLDLTTASFELAPWAGLRFRYGADVYYDWIRSRAWLYYGDVDIVSVLPRGQYVDGAQYLNSGVFAGAELALWRRLTLRAGGRGALVWAQADGQTESESAGVDRVWGAGIAQGGAAVQTTPWLRFAANVNQGFRAPNLDDLTSRQQTGPGFQFEDPELAPERTVTLDFGSMIKHEVVEFDAWVFQTWGQHMIARVAADTADCPVGESGCAGSQTVFTLDNLDGPTIVRGVEGNFRVFMPWDLMARATISYAWGEGENPIPPPDRVPLSRIPPLNGSGELGWRSRSLGLYAMGAVRWATLQNRLAPSDTVDPRIPEGGTPGYAVFDLRGGYRADPRVLVGVIFENLGDVAYRTHGSSINGPGRSVIAHVELGW